VRFSCAASSYFIQNINAFNNLEQFHDVDRQYLEFKRYQLPLALAATILILEFSVSNSAAVFHDQHFQLF
jgi:hypothetical protein